tara:strand:- start:2546 stop:2719 length:174 start_codon:yes stop_codon:yes gene_type:complete
MNYGKHILTVEGDKEEFRVYKDDSCYSIVVGGREIGLTEEQSDIAKIIGLSEEAILS